jgi:hypothetical protein
MLPEAKRPNFFLLGAPKCGTTAVASWLAEHPNVFMSPKKEPHWFNSDMGHIGVPDLAGYEALFEGVAPHHQRIGEASVWYLFSQSAVPNILDYSPDPRFLVMLRNPVDMVFSLHNQLLKAADEDEPDVGRAWVLQADRARGHHVPRVCREPRVLQYGQSCSLGAQLERLYANVPDPERICPVLLEDIARDPRGEFLRILDFLGLPDDGRAEFSVVNAAQARRNRALNRAVKGIGRFKRRLGIWQGLGVLRAIDRWNLRPAGKRRRDPELQAELKAFFREDIRRLERILQRDLGHWLE